MIMMMMMILHLSEINSLKSNAKLATTIIILKYKKEKEKYPAFNCNIDHREQRI